MEFWIGRLFLDYLCHNLLLWLRSLLLAHPLLLCDVLIALHSA